MTIIAYTYEAATHCPRCTRKRFGWTGAVRQNMVRAGRADEHGVSLTAWAKDATCAEVLPVYSHEEAFYSDACNTCHKPLTS